MSLDLVIIFVILIIFIVLIFIFIIILVGLIIFGLVSCRFFLSGLINLAKSKYTTWQNYVQAGWVRGHNNIKKGPSIALFGF